MFILHIAALFGFETSSRTVLVEGESVEVCVVVSGGVVTQSLSVELATGSIDVMFPPAMREFCNIYCIITYAN